MGRVPPEIEVDEHLRIPAGEIALSYARSGGPGGQHVNKTETKVVLRWNAVGSAALDEGQRTRLLEKLGPRLTEAGELIVTSERHRDQGRNVDDALAKFAELLREGLRRPRPRKKTRPSKAAQQRRLTAKRQRGARKRERRAGEDA